jgi:hypothetical protein
MNGLLYSFVKWLEGTGVGTVIRTTRIYPFIQAIHFSGLSLWLATNIVIDLRLLGIGKKRQTAAQLSSALFAWNWIGFLVVVLGGFLLFSGIGTTYLVNEAFRFKLGVFIPIALAWHVFVQQKVSVWGRTSDTPAAGKLSAVVEIILWLCVVTAAVLIPNY